MGSSETDKTVKEPKIPSPFSAPEHSSATSTATVNAEWPGYQAYSPIPPGFMASSHQAHPYMWGVQNLGDCWRDLLANFFQCITALECLAIIMPPYGTPPHPYVAMYPHGGLYAHPSLPPGSYPFAPYAVPSPNGIAEASGNTPVSVDVDSKQPGVKEKLPVKRMRGSLGSLNKLTGKADEEVKTTTNDACSKSSEGGSDGSSEGSDANFQNDSPIKTEGREMTKDSTSQNGNSNPSTQNGAVNTPHTMVDHAVAIPMVRPGAMTPVGVPATNLNIGMDYWGVPASSPIPLMRGQVSPSVAAGLVSAGSRDNLESQLWMQDERELKRQKRKQSNRESARRLRLRKQAECDELAQRAEVLKEENDNLRSELFRIRNENEQLMKENTTLKERLGETPENLESSQTDLCLVAETQESVKTN